MHCLINRKLVAVKPTTMQSRLTKSARELNQKLPNSVAIAMNLREILEIYAIIVFLNQN